MKDVTMTERLPIPYRFTFLHGARVRSGSNYLGMIMSCNPHIQQVPPGKTTDEFPLLIDMDAWTNAFGQFVRRWKGDSGLFELRPFLRHLGTAWSTYLIDTFSLQPGHVFLKYSNVHNIEKFFDLFPDAKLILLVRDGRDNVASSVRAGLAPRAHKTLADSAKMRLNNLFQRDFVTAARDWAAAVKKIASFDEEFEKSRFASQYMILRYEDIYQNPRTMAERVFAFMEVPCDGAILDAVENAEVMGSSFYGKSGQEDAKKPNWVATPKTEAFQPLGRWKSWSARQRNLFKRIAGRELIRMGYEKSLDWA